MTNILHCLLLNHGDPMPLASLTLVNPLIVNHSVDLAAEVLRDWWNNGVEPDPEVHSNVGNTLHVVLLMPSSPFVHV